MDKKWFRELRCGAFMHWGLYAIPGGIWNGEKVPYIGEWIQAIKRIPNAEYSKLAAQFNPIEFDADRIIHDFARAGMKYFVFTSKHHDGFCMFDTKYSDFNSVKASPCHRDFVREFSESCAKYGLKFGVYYSHCLDWHEKDGCDPRPCCKNMGLATWGNDWDFPDQSEKDFEKYFCGKVLPQIEELMTNYGPISMLWNDCPFGDITVERAQKILDIVRKHQPNCMVNGRLCSVKAMGDYGSLGDNQIPSGISPSDYPTEALMTLNDTWGFKYDDINWKNSSFVKNVILDVAQVGANLLINFGPDSLGRIPEGSQTILNELAAWAPAVEEALHCDGRNPFPQELQWAQIIGKGKKLWIFPKAAAGDEAVISGITGKIANCTVEYEILSNGDVKLKTLSRLSNDNLPVCIEFEHVPEYDQRFRMQNGFLKLGAANAKLIHGESGNFVSNDTLGAAGERMDAEEHSSISASGGIINWKNPADAIQWKCYLNKGNYSIRVLTRQRNHRQNWKSSCIIRLAVNGISREISLVASELDDNVYYQGAYSDLGTYAQENDGMLTFELSTVSVSDPTEALQLDCVEIRSEK